MRLVIWIALGLCLCLTTPGAQAGAWLQQAGEGFTSGSTLLRGDASQEASVYLEYGLRPGLTVGGDLNWRNDLNGHALVFARLPLTEFADGGRMAVQVGLGGHRLSGRVRPMAKASLQYGRPLGDGGWLGAEVTAEHRQGTNPLWKFDAVAGFEPWSWAQPMVKLETLYTEGFGFAWALTPSLILNRSGKFQWVAGVELRRAGGVKTGGLSVSLWQRF